MMSLGRRMNGPDHQYLHTTSAREAVSCHKGVPDPRWNFKMLGREGDEEEEEEEDEEEGEEEEVEEGEEVEEVKGEEEEEEEWE